MIEEDSDAENGSENGSEEASGSGSEEGSGDDDEEQNGKVRVKLEPKAGSQADDDEDKNPLDEDNALDGSVTEDDPPENLFEDEDAQMEENKNEAVDPTEENDPTEEPQDDDHTAELHQENTEEPQEETSDPVSVVQEMDHVEHHESEETNPLAGDTDLNEDPFGSTVVAAGDSETPTDIESHPEAGTSVEDLLGETASSAMEAGDKEYKDLIAETQLDNIFN